MATTVLSGKQGGTGVNNSGKTITFAGNVAHAGAFAQTFTATGTTTITLPVTGTLATLAGTETLTNKRITQRIGTTASSATPTPTGDTADQYNITALAANATFAAPSGTPTDGQILYIRIKDNGTARTLAWNAIFRAGNDWDLPTTTIPGNTLFLQFSYNAADSKWDLLNSTIASTKWPIAKMTLNTPISGATSGAFTKLPLDTVVLDPSAGWSSSNSWWQVPAGQGGIYEFKFKLRLDDGTSPGISYGIGADKSAIDTPSFQWFQTGSSSTNRYGSLNSNLLSLVSGDTVFLYYYIQDGGTTIKSAELVIVRIR